MSNRDIQNTSHAKESRASPWRAAQYASFGDESAARIDIFMKRQRTIPNLVSSTIILICCVSIPATVRGQGNIAIETKAFLEHPPAIENITFAKMSKGKGDTNGYSVDGKLFTAGVQGEDFVMAELKTPDEIPQMSTRTLPIVGKAGSFRWSISGMTLNLGQTNGIATPDDPAVSLSQQLETILDEPMNLGIYHAERGTLRVLESGQFSAPIAKRLISWGAQSEVEGRFTFSEDGVRLETASWHISTRPEMVFHIKYSYDGSQTNLFPSAWECSATRNGQRLITYNVSIFKFQLAGSPLPVEFFHPDRFVVKSNLPPIGPIVLVQSNGQALWLQDGKFQVTKIEEPLLELSSQRKVWIIRIVILGFGLGGLVILVRRAFVSAKKRKEKR